MTTKEQIVDTAKKAIIITTDLIKKNLEDLGNEAYSTSSRDYTKDYLAVTKIEGLIDFLKNELVLYQANMESLKKIESFTNQLEKKD